MSETSKRATIYFDSRLHAALRLKAAHTDRSVSARILRRMESLRDDPRPPGSEKLSGRERYRIRQDVYRIVYEVKDKTLIVTVVKVGHRKQAHRNR